MDTFGQWVCNAISAFSMILPSTHPDLTLSALAQETAANVPFIGSQLILEAAQNASIILGFVVPYKIYKIVNSHGI